MSERPTPPAPNRKRRDLKRTSSVSCETSCVLPSSQAMPRVAASAAGFPHTPGSPQVTPVVVPPIPAARIDVSMYDARSWACASGTPNAPESTSRRPATRERMDCLLSGIAPRTNAAPPPAPRGLSRALQARQRDPHLLLVLPGLVLVGDLAHLRGLEEHHLRDALVGVDLRRQRRGVADLERHEALPLGLERRHVREDTAARVRGLAHGDREHVARDAEVLDRARECERVGRHDAH